MQGGLAGFPVPALHAEGDNVSRLFFMFMCSKILLRIWKEEKAETLCLHLLKKCECAAYKKYPENRVLAFARASMGIVARKMRDKRA